MKKLFTIGAIITIMILNIFTGCSMIQKEPEVIKQDEVYYELHTDKIVEVRIESGVESRRDLNALFGGPWDPTDDAFEYPEDYKEEYKWKTDKDFERNVSSMLITYNFE